MSLITFDSSATTLDTFDERHAAESRARAVCQGLIVVDDTSATGIEATLKAALHLVVGSLLIRQPRADVAILLRHLAKQVTRDGIVIQGRRVASLD